MRTIARHEVVPDADGCRVTLSIEQTGPMGAVAARVAPAHAALHRARGREPGQAGHRHPRPVTPQVPGPASTTPRDRLLDAAIDHFGQHGIGDTSLRGIAEALGTSHRMLIYHFGPRRPARRGDPGGRGAAAGGDDGDVRHRPPAARGRREVLGGDGRGDAALRPLFFELAAHAMQGKEHAAALRDELIAAWLPSVIELCRAIGIPEEQTEAHARLALGAARPPPRPAGQRRPRAGRAGGPAQLAAPASAQVGGAAGPG